MSIQISDRINKRNPYQISSYNELTSINSEFKREGYEISSWNTEKDGSGIPIPLDMSFEISSDNTLFAQWNPITYRINYELFGGINDSSNPSSYTIITQKTNLKGSTKSGYTFDSWFDNNGNVSSIGGGSIGNINLSASYIRNKVSAIYYANIPQNDILGFTACDGDATIKLETVGSPMPIQLKYSNDGENWNEFKTDTNYDITSDSTMYIMGNNQEYECSSTSKYYKFSMTGKIKASGNIDYLRSEDGKPGRLKTNCYFKLFYNCSSLIEPPSLPNTQISDCCYQQMFKGCNNLSIVPQLPASGLYTGCYSGMFWSCEKITTPPILSSTSLVKSCYSYMFVYCSSLTSTPVLPALTVEEESYHQMFTWCTNLSSISEIKAKTVGRNSCWGMFARCINLSSPPHLNIRTVGSNSLKNMFSNCSSLTSTPEFELTNTYYNCCEGMFNNCVNISSLPILSVSTLCPECYKEMFLNCKNIKVNTEYADNRVQWSIPSGGKYYTDWNKNMLSGTSGNFTGYVTPGTIYYVGE